MNPPTSSSVLLDSTVVREWYAQLAEASKTPGLVQHLVRRTGELLPRFVAYYDMLRAVPRRIRRALVRGRGLTLGRVALLLALCGAPLHAAVISVNGTTCTLADAIVAANTDTATGGCPAGSGQDLVRLDADVTLSASLPSLTSAMKVQAAAGSTVDGNGNPCFVVESSGDAVLKGLTVQNCVAFEGGAVLNKGTLTINRCRITGNSASYGGGVSNDGTGSNVGSLTIAGSDISGNTASDGGGGVATDYGVVKISDTTITGNSAAADGGGVHSYGGKVTLTNCTVSGNTASRGGGLVAGFYFTPDFDAAVLKIQKCTISGNVAAALGGGVFLYQRGALNLIDSTVSGNSATSVGGGVAADTWYGEGFLNVINSTISGNTVGREGGGIYLATAGPGGQRVTLKHGLISGNTASMVPEMSADNGPFTLTVDDYNLFGQNADAGVSGFTPGATDIVPGPGVTVNDILFPLANNGGPTQTHALVPGGPAVDAVPTGDGNCIGTTDQRGVSRPQGDGCDVGSFEVEAP
jgi:hypothetical protein